MKQIKSALLYSIIAFPITIWPMEPFLKWIKLESRQDEASPFEQFNQLPSDVQKKILLFAASPKAHIDYGQEKDETKKYVGEILHVKAFIKRLASYKAINKKINNLLTPKEIIESILGKDIKNDTGNQTIINNLFQEIFEQELSYIFRDEFNKYIERERINNIFYSSYQDGNLLKLLLESGYINDINAAIDKSVTPLESAVNQDLPELAQLLINHGADPYQKISVDKEDKMILDLTKENSLMRSILLKEKRLTTNTSSITDYTSDNFLALLYRIIKCAMKL